jgi:hypothetical protein
VRWRFTLDVELADGGCHPADILADLCQATREHVGSRVMGALVKEVPDDQPAGKLTTQWGTVNHPEA